MITSQSIFEKRSKWVARLKMNPPKTTGVLMSPYGTCCLGEFCLMEGVSKIVIDDKILFNNEYQILSPVLRSRLNITKNGELTKEGEKVAQKFFRVRNETGCLASINDNLTESHKQMGEFLEALLVREYLFGEHMFQPSDFREDIW